MPIKLDNSIKAVCYDLDGVLAPLTQGHFEVLNQALGLFGYRITEEMHQVEYNGLPTKKKLQMLTEQKGLPKALHTLISDLKQLYTVAYIEQNIRPEYDKIVMLRYLKDKGIKLACVSNSVQKTVRLVLEKMRIEEYFDVVIGNDMKIAGKPLPDLYLAAFQKLGVRPEESLIVEDSEYGKKAAIASGGVLIPVANEKQVNLSLFL